MFDVPKNSVIYVCKILRLSFDGTFNNCRADKTDFMELRNRERRIFGLLSCKMSRRVVLKVLRSANTIHSAATEFFVELVKDKETTLERAAF